MTTPYAHQQSLLDQNPDRHGLWWGTRVGKTLTSIWLANARKTPFLVVTRKTLAKQWDEECHKSATTGFAVLSKENFKKTWQELPHFDTVIFDEAHDYAGELKGSFAKNTATLAKVTLQYIKKHEPKSRYLLTATPYRCSPWNTYRLAHLLGRDWKRDDFANAFFTKKLQHIKRCPKGRCSGCHQCSRLIEEIRKDNPTIERLRKAERNLGSVVRLADCYDMPKEIHDDIEMAMSKEQMTRLAKLPFHNQTDHRISRHRLECGHVYHHGYEETEYLASPVNDYVLERVAEYRKLVIVCLFREHITHLESLIEGRKVITLVGGMDDFHEKRKEAEALDDCIVIVQSQCSAGYELRSFEAIVFASCGYSYVDYEQMLGRIRGIGKKSPCLYLYPTCGEIGKAVIRNVREKKDYQP